MAQRSAATVIGGNNGLFAATYLARVASAPTYLCGAGIRPGGEVTGAPGHDAAQAILPDLATRR